MNLKHVGIFGFLVWLSIFIAAAVGWVMNIVKIVHAISDPITLMEILRIVGVFFFPLGAILGYC